MSRRLSLVLYLALTAASAALWLDQAIRRAFRCRCDGCDS